MFVRCAVVLFFVFLACAAFGAHAQAPAFKAGDRIEYKASSHPETWKPGTIVRVMPQYQQVLVRWDPRDDYPGYTHDGVSTYEQAYPIGDVRPIARAAPPAAPAGAPPLAAPATPPQAPAPAPHAAAATGAPMTRQEITGYMRAHAYAGGQPTHDAGVCRDLVAQIKARGVVEALQVGRDDLSAFADNGCFGAQDTDVVAASRSNLGAPTPVGWLAGTWILYVVGGTVDTAPGDGYIYRRNESMAKLGWLRIDAGGTYTWKVEPADPPEKYVHGSWRLATAAEMQLQGGAGVVLQHAAEGADWIAFRYMDVSNQAERIQVEHLQSRGAYRRIGWRS